MKNPVGRQDFFSECLGLKNKSQKTGGVFMTLSFEQIKEITNGVQRIEQLDDGIHFYRFSEKEQSVYDGHDFFKKTYL